MKAAALQKAPQNKLSFQLSASYPQDLPKLLFFCPAHGRIIKWTQHVSFLTLAVMERVVEGNYGNDLKESKSSVLIQFGEI